LGNATLAGLATGFLVGGVGGRIVMRLSAIAADSDGLLTESENRVGDITVGGTVAIVIFVGAFAGVAGGVVLFAARPWLPRSLVPRALLFAAILPLTIGTIVVTSENPDFRLLDPPELSIAMFAGLFALFGAVVVVAEARIDRAIPRAPLGANLAGAIYFGAAVPAMLGVSLLAGMLFVDGACGCRAPRVVGVLFVLMGAATIARIVTRAGGAHAGRLGSAIAPLGYASLIGACVAGSLYAAREIGAIL
ncbi:MAG: hypothetical protein O3C25_04400, partial [Chloroflexi bacterium]|nr:hypothetical protein [Chloroflexota bacterium]